MIQFAVGTRVCWKNDLDSARNLRSTCGRVERYEHGRASYGQRNEEGLFVCLLSGLTWSIAFVDSNLDFRQRCWSASASLFDSDKRFGVLDRMVVRRYVEYESVRPVLRCEGPVLCAHSLNAQTQPRRETEEAERVSSTRRMQRLVD